MSATVQLIDACEAFQCTCDHAIDQLLWSRARKAVTDPDRFLRRMQRQQGIFAAEFRAALEKWFRVIDMEYLRVLRHLHIEKVVQGDILTRLLNWRWIKENGEILRNAELRIYQQGAEKAVQFAGLAAAFDINNPRFAQVAEARAGALVTGITETMRQNIHDTVTNAIASGQSIDEMTRLLRPGLPALPVSVKRIQGQMAERIAAGVPQAKAEAWATREMTHMRNYRAHMIARTEGSAAMNDGAILGYEAAGVKKVEWLAQFDACEVCASFAGQEFRIEDSHGLLPEHCNCLCSFAAVIGPEVLGEEGEFIPSYFTPEELKMVSDTMDPYIERGFVQGQSGIRTRRDLATGAYRAGVDRAKVDALTQALDDWASAVGKPIRTRSTNWGTKAADALQDLAATRRVKEKALWRGLGWTNPQQYQDFVTPFRANIGQTYTFPQLQGFTKAQGQAQAFAGNRTYGAVMEVVAPKGVTIPGFDIAAFSPHNELEVILPEGLQFKIISVELVTMPQTGMTVPHIVLELIAG